VGVDGLQDWMIGVEWWVIMVCKIG
jgi:hypothetical protein